MRELYIGKDDANQRVDKFIQKTMKTMPKNLMYKYIRNKKIKVNRKRCEISQRLIEGDTMQCFIPEEFFEIEIRSDFLKVPANIDVVYEDAYMLIMNKEKGLRAHKDTADMQDNLTDRMLHYLYHKKEYDPQTSQSFTPALCHRIDRNTQGLVIGAKCAQALRLMNEKIAARDVKKRYLCIVEGAMPKTTDIIHVWHKKMDDNTAHIINYEKEGYVCVDTGYRTLDSISKYSLLEVDLYTGKSHQIRAVMAYINHPLYGDVKYGAHKTKTLEYQALCAYEIEFAFTSEAQELQWIQGKQIRLAKNDVMKLWKKLKNEQ